MKILHSKEKLVNVHYFVIIKNLQEEMFVLLENSFERYKHFIEQEVDIIASVLMNNRENNYTAMLVLSASVDQWALKFAELVDYCDLVFYQLI